MVDYHILQQFVTFYRTGTLRETAEKLHISQPTLTRNMQKLESEFEVPLFTRTRNSISLNETGIIAAEDAEMLLKQTEIMLRHARDFDRVNRTIMVGSCTPVHVPDIIRRLSVSCPNAAISSEIKKIPCLLDGIKDGTYQLVLLPFCPKDKELYSMKWCEEHLSFLLPKRHRFATVFFHDCFPDTAPATSRVSVPITDPEFNVSYYLVCKEKNTSCSKPCILSHIQFMVFTLFLKQRLMAAALHDLAVIHDNNKVGIPDG